jgi:hypothetical protein
VKKKIILTDADGVLVFWFAGFEKFMNDKGYNQVTGTEHHYAMSTRYNISDEEAHFFIKEYNESPYIADLDAYADSQEYVAKLVAHGFKFVVITSLSSNPDAARYRKENLIKLFGDNFLEIMCLKMGSAKDKALKPWEGSGFFWIEDHIKNAEDGHSLGLKSILVQQDHNGHYDTDHFSIVGPEQPWKEIYELVSKEYNL